MYWQIIRKEKNVNNKDNFKKYYKFKINLLLSIKLIFLNLNKLDNWILYIKMK